MVALAWAATRGCPYIKNKLMALNFLKAIEPGGRADYGLDAPGVISTLGLAGVVQLGLITFLSPVFKKRWKWLRLALLLVGGYNLFQAAAMLYYSKHQKFKHRDRILDLSGLRPDAKVLDIGSGRGLLAIGAAKRSPGIKVTAIDIWQTSDLSANSEEALRSNIDLEEVGGRVHVYEADARKLPFADGEFDLIVSNLCLHNIGKGESGNKSQARHQALLEIARVLKPGGRAVLSDFLHTKEYTAELKKLNFVVERHGPYLDTYPALTIVNATKS